jgi:hypothetical protein
VDLKNLVLKNKPEVKPHEMLAPEVTLASPVFVAKIKNFAQDLDSRNLIDQVESILKKTKKIESTDFEKGLLAVNELILRNPNVYSSYKAKLILLLRKEGSKQGIINDTDVKNLLDTMSRFDITSDSVLRKEAFLIAKTNAEIDQLVFGIENLEDKLVGMKDQVQIQVIESEINGQLDKLAIKESLFEDDFLSDPGYLNEDLVEIPLYRALAKEDFYGVIETAEVILDDFPSSVFAHFFLIRALELAGRENEALELIVSTPLKPSELASLKERLIRERKLNAKEYWKNLRF